MLHSLSGWQEGTIDPFEVIVNVAVDIDLDLMVTDGEAKADALVELARAVASRVPPQA